MNALLLFFFCWFFQRDNFYDYLLRCALEIVIFKITIIGNIFLYTLSNGIVFLEEISLSDIRWLKFQWNFTLNFTRLWNFLPLLKRVQPNFWYKIPGIIITKSVLISTTHSNEPVFFPQNDTYGKMLGKLKSSSVSDVRYNFGWMWSTLSTHVAPYWCHLRNSQEEVGYHVLSG